MFEKVARASNWPEDKWTLLVQFSVLQGKAQEAYAVLDADQSSDYRVIREVVLAAYEVVPEAYRQRFRSLWRKPVDNFLELVRQQEVVFDRWLAASNTYTFQELRQLMLVEQFKSSLPRPIEVHLNDGEITQLKLGAMTADSYELTLRRRAWKGPIGRQEMRV